MKRAPFLVPALGLLVAATGCARDDRSYPSLAPRAVEKLGFAEPDVPQQTLVPDPALDARIVEKRQALEKIAAGFDAAAAKAATLARTAKGQAVGSDAWLDAQSALATLDDWRAQTSALTGDVDSMIADRAATLAPVYPGLAALRAAAVSEGHRQTQRIDSIEATIPPA